jgi:hypothetical protein
MKKVIYFLMAGILACQFMITNVLAADELVDLDAVAKKGNEYLSSTTNILKNDSENKQFVATYSGDEDSEDIIYYYPYENDYLEFENDNINTCDDFGDALYDSFSLSLIMVGVYYAAGCTDDEIYNIVTWMYDEKFSNYDKYGVILKKNDFKNNEENTSCSGDYISYLKISFDKEKIQNLIKDFGTTQNPSYVIVPPTVLFGTTSADYISVAAKLLEIENIYNDKDCNIYRSESADGEYKLIGTVACDGSNYLYDKDVVKGKKYFYKASVVGSNNLSEAYGATAVTAESKTTSNPDTGISIAYVLGALILVLTFATAIVFDRDKIEVK